MAEVEIGYGKSARRAFALDDVSIVPSRRTRNAADVDVSWQIDAYRFSIPVLGAPLDSVTSPATAVEMDRLGGAGVLDLEGLWTRWDDPTPHFERLRSLDGEAERVALLRELYEQPIRDELITARIAEIKDAGAVATASLRPQLVERYAKLIASSGLDLFVIRAPVVSAEHVSKSEEPLNLKRFIREYEIPTLVGGCASYQGALHLMRSGAMGVLVGVGANRHVSAQHALGVGVAHATAIADARGARMRHLDETGVYCHVIADGGIVNGGALAKAIVCGADAVMIAAPLVGCENAPAKGVYWSPYVAHPTLPRGRCMDIPVNGTIENVLLGPGTHDDERRNIIGTLKSAMALSGYESLKDFQKAELVVRERVGS
jgi:IMP dehydrogenase